MSINDLLDSKGFLLLVLVAIWIGMLFFIPGLYAVFKVAKKAKDNIFGDDDEYEVIKEIESAKIIARRSTPHPLNQSVIVNTVVFELSNGNRIELAIKDPDTFGVMIEGDVGTLIYQGKKFIDFERGGSSEM